MSDYALKDGGGDVATEQLHNPTVGTYGTTSTGYVTFTFDHETVANRIEGGTWVPMATLPETWGVAGDRHNVNFFADWKHFFDSTTYYNPYTRTVYSARFTVNGVETVGLPVSTVNRYIDISTTQAETWLWTSVWGREGYAFPEERGARQRKSLQEIIKARHSPAIIIRPSRTPLPNPLDDRERRARETLRRVIGEDKWRSFVKHGFISVRANSGRTYQIFPAHNFTKVYERGVLIERLCVVLRGNFPPTDSLVMRYLMILNDETDFWKRAVKQGNWGDARPTQFQPEQSLVEAAKQIRVA